MRKIAILAATLAATPCLILGVSAQNQAGGLGGNLNMSDMQHPGVGIGQPERGFRANDMTVARSERSPTTGTLARSGTERLDLANSTAATTGFVTSNPTIKP